MVENRLLQPDTSLEMNSYYPVNGFHEIISHGRVSEQEQLLSRVFVEAWCGLPEGPGGLATTYICINNRHNYDFIFHCYFGRVELVSVAYDSTATATEADYRFDGDGVLIICRSRIPIVHVSAAERATCDQVQSPLVSS